MVRVLMAAAMLASLAVPVFADECSAWQSGINETEEGSAMSAWICSGPKDDQATLTVQCTSPGSINVLLNPPPSLKTFPPGEDEDYQTQFSFDNGTGQMTEILLRYEDMDVAMAGELMVGSPSLKLLETGKDLTIVSSEGRIGPIVFPLKGAKEAMAKVNAACTAPQ